MITERMIGESLEAAAAAPTTTGLFDVVKRARSAGVKILDIMLVILTHKGDVPGMISAIQALIPTPPVE